MTSPIVDEDVAPLAELLLACLAEQVQALAKPPRTVSLRPGIQVELLLSTSRDECCEGVGWVRLADDYPAARDFPAEDPGPQNCLPMRSAVVFEIGIARCAPTPGVEDIPSAEAWNEVTRAVLDDRVALWRTLCCFLAADDQPRRLYVIGHWQPLPVEGGCVGGTRTITLAVDECVDCGEVESEVVSISATVIAPTVGGQAG